MKLGLAILEILKREGVGTIYGYPLNVLTEYATLSGVRPLLARAERTAGHMADAIARSTGGEQIGVFFTQHGPGIENAMGAIAQAYSESVPLLVLPMGYARRHAQIDPNFSATTSLRPFAKSVESLTSAADLPAVMRRAFSQLRTGRGGPVVVEIPIDLWPEETPEPLDYQPVTVSRYGPDPADVARAADLLLAARHPLLYVGQGVHYARAWVELRALAEWLALPVMTTLEGKSAFPEDHALALGAGGMAMPKTVHHYLHHADLILGVGCSFTESSYAVSIPRGPKIIHATLDPRHLNKDVAADVGLIGDARLALRALLAEVKARVPQPRPQAAIAAEIAALRAAWLAEWQPKLDSDEVPLSPYRLIRDLMRTVDLANTIITHDAGNPRDQLATFWVSRAPLSYLGWGKTTQLGYGLGLAMGAKMAHPDKLCINVWGDAAFGFTGLELETAVRERIPVLSILMNNSCMATELQMMAASTQKYRSTDIGGNYADLARSLGAYAERVTQPAEIIAAIRRGIEQTRAGKPALLEFITARETAVSKYAAGH
jgi:thiamine pyrophosphate-dependent acetolactate synthase large subunit-like protein